VAWVNERLHVGCAIFHGEGGVLECVDLVQELAGRYQLAELVYDPWRFGQAAQELAQRGIPVVEFPQTDQRMIPASNRLHEAITESRLLVPDDPELRAHAANAVAKHSRRGWRIDKPRKEIHIDAIIALCMALEQTQQPAQELEFVGWL
jgi:phage terminase large subunit-like protein